MKEDNQSCDCMACQMGNEKIQEMENKSLKEVGWYAHMERDPVAPMDFNYHTHGFPDKYGQPDIQIVFPMPAMLAHMMCQWIMRALLDKGITMEPGKMYTDVLEGGLPIQFIEAVECERKVMRVILPDKQGKFDSHPYIHQFEMTGFNRPIHPALVSFITGKA